MESRVKFEGIDEAIEDRKTKKGAQERKLRRAKRKVAKRARAENIKFFILYLETLQPKARHEMMDQFDIERLERMFPDIAPQERLRAFDQVVETRMLPPAPKLQREQQLECLLSMQWSWGMDHRYSTLDRFFQYLRETKGKFTLEAHLQNLTANSPKADRAIRDFAGAVNDLSVLAQHLSEETKQKALTLGKILLSEDVYSLDGYYRADFSLFQKLSYYDDDQGEDEIYSLV